MTLGALIEHLAETALEGKYHDVLHRSGPIIEQVQRAGDSVPVAARRRLYQAGSVSAWRTGNWTKYEEFKRRMAHLPRQRKRRM